MYETLFALRTPQINAVTWTDISAATGCLPIDCNTVTIINLTGVDIYLRSDPANAASQITIKNGQQFPIGGAAGSAASACRFPKGCPPAGALLSSAGNVNPIVESIK